MVWEEEKKMKKRVKNFLIQSILFKKETLRVISEIFEKKPIKFIVVNTLDGGEPVREKDWLEENKISSQSHWNRYHWQLSSMKIGKVSWFNNKWSNKNFHNVKAWRVWRPWKKW